MKVLAISVTPSPYQREFFRALQRESGIDDLQVCYLEEAADDSPWKLDVLEPWERILPGRVLGKGRVRCHWNTALPDLREWDRVIVNAPLTAATTQRVFRQLDRVGAPAWAFWGELLLRREGLRGWIQRRLAARLDTADAIVAIGRTAKADYERRFPGVPVHDIPYACDLEVFQTAARVRQTANACRFLFAGQMISRKGVDVLLNAFANLRADGLPVELHLAGREGELSGWLDGLPQGVRGAIVYHGFIQPPGLPELFARADVFVLPSRHDGWGVVVNQALGAGMPVVTSTAAGAGRDLVEDQVNGIHVAPGDLSQLEAAMRDLATRPERRAAMSIAANVSAERIGPEAAAGKWLGVLRGLRD